MAVTSWIILILLALIAFGTAEIKGIAAFVVLGAALTAVVDGGAQMIRRRRRRRDR